MKVRIFKPSRSAMQSGLGKTHIWVLEPEVTNSSAPEPLMGWAQGHNTMNQVRMKFQTCEEAAAYAQQKGWEYTISADHAKKIRPRNYADNFRYFPPQEKV